MFARAVEMICIDWRLWYREIWREWTTKLDRDIAQEADSDRWNELIISDIQHDFAEQ